MSETIDIKRHQKTGDLLSAIDVVFSPDDGGYYGSEHNFSNKSQRVTRHIYATRAECIEAMRSGKRVWEAWD